MERYRRALLPFVAFLVERDFVPHGAEQWDDLLVEWRNDTRPLKSNFEACVAAIEFVFPRFRRHLSWSHAVIAGWAVAHVARHTVPLGLGPACLLATLLSSDHPRLGLGIVLQRLLGMRPSELLSIQCQDVALPEHSASAQSTVCIIGLGIRGGTKAKRAQAVMLRDTLGIGIVRWLCSETPSDKVLIPYTYEQYRSLMQKTERKLGLEIGWTPHSPRSGFASELTAAGVPFVELRERGRWLADSSLRTYVDLVTSANIAVSLRLSGLVTAIAYAQAHFLEFFPGARHFCTEALRDGREGFFEGAGRADGRTLGSAVGAEASGLPADLKAPDEESGEPCAGVSSLSGPKPRQVAQAAKVARTASSRGRGSHSRAAPSLAHASEPSQLVVGRSRGRGRGHLRE